jgi:hypothetical protein
VSDPSRHESCRIELCYQRRLRMNAGFCHGTLQLGADCVNGQTEFSGNVYRPPTLGEVLDDTCFRFREVPRYWRSDLHTSRARCAGSLHHGIKARSLADYITQLVYLTERLRPSGGGSALIRVRRSVVAANHCHPIGEREQLSLGAPSGLAKNDLQLSARGMQADVKLLRRVGDAGTIDEPLEQSNFGG